MHMHVSARQSGAPGTRGMMAMGGISRLACVVVGDTHAQAVRNRLGPKEGPQGPCHACMIHLMFACWK